MILKIRYCTAQMLVFVSLILLIAPSLVLGSEQGVKYANQAYSLLTEGKDLQAVLIYRKAVDEGLNDPSIMRNMALAFYNLRMLDEAIDYMERGVEVSPMDPNMLCELGILYGAKGELQKATSMLIKSLQLDPGQGEAYFYLGLSLIRQGKISLAWQAARIGEKLHYNQELLLEELLLNGAPEPKHYPFQEPSPIFALRQIILTSFEQGESLVARWNRGESLGEYFWGRSKDTSRSFGGYIGAYSDAELKPEVLTAIEDKNIYDQPIIVKTDDTYILVQRIWPFDSRYWSELDEKRIVSGKTKNIAPVEVSVPLEILPIKAMSKTNLGDKDPYELEKSDPQKIRLYSGAFIQKEIAIEQVIDLRDQGFLAYYLIDRKSDGETLFNVIAGEYSSREEALKAKEKLLEKGHESFLSNR